MRRPASDFLFLSVSDIARICGVSLKTAKRWKSGTTCPPPYVAMILRGNLGALDPEWAGWVLKAGKLYSPEGDEYLLGDVRAVPFMRQQIFTYHTENRKLREQLEGMEEQPAPSDWDWQELVG